MPYTYGIVERVFHKTSQEDGEKLRYPKGGIDVRYMEDLLEGANPLRGMNGEIEGSIYYFEDSQFDSMVQPIEPLKEIERLRGLRKSGVAKENSINVELAIRFLDGYIKFSRREVA